MPDAAHPIAPSGPSQSARQEAAAIAAARADADAGLLIDEAEMDAWIDSLGTTHELPPPRAHR